MQQQIYKPFLVFLSILLIIGVILWFSSPVSELNWGKWNLFYFKNYLQFVIIGLIILGIFVFNRELENAKKIAAKEQEVKDYRKFTRLLNIRNKNLEKEVDILKHLLKDKNLAEEKIAEIFQEIKDKIELSQIYELPEFAMILIEKIINIKDEFGVKFHTEIEGNLSSLSRISFEDLKETIELLVTPICDNFYNIDIENRTDINLFIREYEKKIIFKVMHDYNSKLIQTDMMEWNLKKLLHKYGGSITASQEQEEDATVLMITLDIPKEVKAKKII